ncbi:MAG: hypothetical protein K9L17_09810 [Clostridiales bacterium]|nr:hypothetical protein [Clostridiales bacterium]MCF8022975.1 hypothetical protein [Clostridiales bacterium]
MIPQKENTKESTQDILLEIVQGIKEKFILPLANENKRIYSTLEKFQNEEKKEMEELKKRIENMERKVENNPATVLSAIRDAINQSHGGNNDGSS